MPKFCVIIASIENNINNVCTQHWCRVSDDKQPWVCLSVREAYEGTLKNGWNVRKKVWLIQDKSGLRSFSIICQGWVLLQSHAMEGHYERKTEKCTVMLKSRSSEVKGLQNKYGHCQWSLAGSPQPNQQSCCTPGQGWRGEGNVPWGQSVRALTHCLLEMERWVEGTSIAESKGSHWQKWVNNK